MVKKVKIHYKNIHNETIFFGKAIFKNAHIFVALTKMLGYHTFVTKKA